MLMFPSARRVDGEEQPYIPLGIFKLRIPFVHFEWQTPEMIQAIVVFVTGVAATAYLQEIFGLSFEQALAIVCIHELLYALQNLFGDPIVGGWITPALPLVTVYFLTIPEGVDRIHALIALQLVLGFLFLILGTTGIAGKLVGWTPNSVKAGILIGAGIAAVIGKYGFMSLENGGIGFYKYPFSFSTGVLLSLFLLFSIGFRHTKKVRKDNRIIKSLSKYGFVPALAIAFIIGIVAKELQMPVIDQFGLFNPLPHLRSFVWQEFSVVGLGFPPLQAFIDVIPMAIIAYVIAFGDIVAGTEFLKETDEARQDEKIDVNPNRTNIMCGIRNTLQGFFFPTVTLSGPLWSAMMVTIAERYKTGKENMYSIWGGVNSFNITKFLCCLILPLIALVRPILPLSMSITLMIQAFGCFYVALNMLENNQERGVAGIVGSVLAIAGPAVGLITGIIVALVVQFIGTGILKKDPVEEN